MPILLARTTDQQVAAEQAAAEAAGQAGSEPMCEEVAAVSDTLTALRRQLHCLQRELCRVSPEALMALWGAHGALGGLVALWGMLRVCNVTLLM